MGISNLAVRGFQIDDAEKIRTIASQCQPLLINGVYVNLFLAKYFGSTCFILEEQKKAIGYITGLKSSNSETLFLWQLAILPEYRAKGFSQKLIAKAVEAARNLRCKNIQFSISPGNAQSFGAFSSFAKKNCLEMKVVDERKYRDPLADPSTKTQGHEIFYEIPIK